MGMRLRRGCLLVRMVMSISCGILFGLCFYFVNLKCFVL